MYSTIMRPTYKRSFSVIDIFNMLVLFFIFMGAMDVINRYYYWVYIAFLIYICTPKRKINVNVSFVFLLLLSLSILMFNSVSHQSITNMIKPFTFPVCYVMGTGLLNEVSSVDEIQKKFKNVKNSVTKKKGVF